MEDDELTDKFNAAAKHLETLISRKIDDQILLSLYGLFKVSTVGLCNTPRPGWYEFTAKAKWDAWNKLKISSAEAKLQYCQIIEQLDPEWTPDTKSPSWVNVSSMVNTDPELAPADKTIFDFIKENDITKVKLLLDDANLQDESGMGLIHWCCDRGNTEILKFLIEAGADVNLIGEDGQTGLHYAASCGHLDCAKLLLENKADVGIQDADGMLAADVASETEISQLIQNFS